MTETTGKIKINDVAKAVAKNANDQLRAMKDVQDYLRAQTDSLRKLEAELVRKAREQQSQGTAKAEEPVAEPQKTAAITPAPAGYQNNRNKGRKTQRGCSPPKTGECAGCFGAKGIGACATQRRKTGAA